MLVWGWRSILGQRMFAFVISSLACFREVGILNRGNSVAELFMSRIPIADLSPLPSQSSRSIAGLCILDHAGRSQPFLLKRMISLQPSCSKVGGEHFSVTQRNKVQGGLHQVHRREKRHCSRSQQLKYKSRHSPSSPR
ncbi:hypothetical protein F5Y15DRAFT_234659 [Xylariaceae sp. FL0016]|nr:hypothetical protein F5Y15DRAFT_234659 [Xylariaceae sp. FL0016]